MENSIETEAKFIFKEKRKWQIALRRYILSGLKCVDYASYFGIDSANFRKWIETHFDEDINWGNFSKAWQFDHIIPVAYFNLREERDLRLCWNFINIRVEKNLGNKNRGNRLDVLATKIYFEQLYTNTGYVFCKQMIEKIEKIEVPDILSNLNQYQFLNENKEYLNKISNFTAHDFHKLNSGYTTEDIVKENAFLKKFE
jgi:hypothetical protein